MNKKEEQNLIQQYEFLNHRFDILNIVYYSKKSVILRAIDKENGDRKVILKTFSMHLLNEMRKADERPQSIALEKEYHITKKLEGHPHIIEFYEFNNEQDRPFIVMENFRGLDLNHHIKNREFDQYSEDQMYSIILQIIKALNYIHENNIVHKDIKPSNILYDLELSQLKIIDFSISQEVAKEKAHLDLKDDIEGTINYISPEQTAKTVNPVDFRSDYYSLGITLYHLLSGQLPFQSSDTVELIAHHLATRPRELNKVDSKVSKGLSQIVMGLIEKSPKDRYQSGYGLYKDIELAKELKGDENFVIKGFDRSQYLEWEDYFCCREEEVRALRKSWDFVINQSSVHWQIVSGEEGVGKSRLLGEFAKYVWSNQGVYFAQNCSQEGGQEAALKNIFQKMADFILGLSVLDFEKVKEELTEQLDGNRFLVNGLAPMFFHIFGEEEEKNQDNLQSIRPRLIYSLATVIRIFTQKIRPMVIALSDINEKSGMAVDLLKQLLQLSLEIQEKIDPNETLGEENSHLGTNIPLMIICSEKSLKEGQEEKKDNFAQFFQSHFLNQKVISTGQLNLQSFSKAQVRTWMSQLVKMAPGLESSFITKIYQVTQGNPLFIRNFIEFLQKNGAFFFHHDQGIWVYEKSKIGDIGIPSGWLDMVIKRLENLNLEFINLLQWSSCFPNDFRPKQLATVMDLELDEINQLFHQCIDEGVLSKKIESNQAQLFYGDYKFSFVHPDIKDYFFKQQTKVQMATRYGHIFSSLRNQGTNSEDEYEIYNLAKIARRYLRYDTPLSKKELFKVIDTNLNGGIKAYSSQNFPIALKLLKFSFQYWKEMITFYPPEKIINHCIIYSECLLMYDHTDLFITFSEKVYPELGQFSEISSSQMGRLHELRSICAYMKMDAQKCIEHGLRACKYYGLKLPLRLGAKRVTWSLLMFRWKLINFNPDEILNYPPLKDEGRANIIRSITHFMSLAIMAKRKDIVLIYNIEAFYIAINHGLSPFSLYSFTALSIRVIFPLLKMVKLSYRLCHSVIKICKRPEYEEVIPVLGLAFTGGADILTGEILLLRKMIPLQRKLGKKWGIPQTTRNINLSNIMIMLQKRLPQDESYYREKESIVKGIESLLKSYALTEVEPYHFTQSKNMSITAQFFTCSILISTEVITQNNVSKEIFLFFKKIFLETPTLFFSGPQEIFQYFSSSVLIITQYNDWPPKLQRSFSRWIKKSLQYHKSFASCLPNSPPAQVYQLSLGCLELLKERPHKAYQYFNTVHQSWLKNPFMLYLTPCCSYLMSVAAKRMNRRLLYRQALILTLNGLIKWGAYALAEKFIGRFYHDLRDDDLLPEGRDIISEFHQKKTHDEELDSPATLTLQGRSVTHTHQSTHQATHQSTHQRPNLTQTTLMKSIKSNETGMSSLSNVSSKVNHDWLSIIKIGLSFAEIKNREELVKFLMEQVANSVGAKRVLVMLPDRERTLGFSVEGDYQHSKNILKTFHRGQIDESMGELAQVVIRAMRTRSYQLVNNWSTERVERYKLDQNIQLPPGWTVPKSILVYPVESRSGQIISLIYLDHDEMVGLFRKERLKITSLIFQNASMALENLFLGENMEALVSRQTQKILDIQEQLKTQAHASGMSDIISSILHEFGNTFVKIQLYLNQLSENQVYRLPHYLGKIEAFLSKFPDDLNSRDKEEVIKSINEIKNSTDLWLKDHSSHIQKTTEELLQLDQNIKKKENLSKAPRLMIETNLSHLVQEINKEMPQEFRSSRHIHLVVDDNMNKTIPIDRYKIKFSLTQLIRNSYEAVQERISQMSLGQVSQSITTKQTDVTQDLEIFLTLNEDEEFYNISCHDQGVGVNPEMATLLFRPGQTTKGQGRGMGLHEAANYMNACGGKIQYLNEEENAQVRSFSLGSTFVLSIPKTN